MSNLRELREHAGWSQWQLARAATIDRTRISLIENRHVIPRTDEEERIEEVLLAEIALRAERFRNIGRQRKLKHSGVKDCHHRKDLIYVESE